MTHLTALFTDLVRLETRLYNVLDARLKAEHSLPLGQFEFLRFIAAHGTARVWAMKQEEAHSDTSRVDTAQRVFLRNGNLELDTPLDWKVYGDSYHIG